ncbi:hypothetical protein HK102_012033, partial [Quaeritorhiza haematococci]
MDNSSASDWETSQEDDDEENIAEFGEGSAFETGSDVLEYPYPSAHRNPQHLGTSATHINHVHRSGHSRSDSASSSRQTAHMMDLTSEDATGLPRTSVTSDATFDALDADISS